MSKTAGLELMLQSAFKKGAMSLINRLVKKLAAEAANPKGDVDKLALDMKRKFESIEKAKVKGGSQRHLLQ